MPFSLNAFIPSHQPPNPSQFNLRPTMKPRRSAMKPLRALTLTIEVLVISQSLTLSSDAATTLNGDHVIVNDGSEQGNLTVTGVGSFGTGVDLGSCNQVSIDWDSTATTNIFDINPSQGAFLWRDLKSSAPTVMRNKMTLDANNSLTLYDSLGETTHSIILNGNTGKISLRGAGSGINLITSYTNGIPNTTSVFTLDSAGNLAIASPTASTSSSDGALTVLGGIGVAKDSYFNGVRVGRGAGNISTNTVLGNSALQANTTGYQNTATGYYSLQRNTTGWLNTATGAFSLLGNTTGSLNTATGAFSLVCNTTGYQNTASGWGALQYNTTGSSNTATGSNSLSANTTGYDNTSSGANSLRYNTTGSSNTATGASSLRINTTGSNNTAYGMGSLQINSTGMGNTGLGYNSGASNGVGSYNVFVGHQAGRCLPSQRALVPSNSIYIGSGALGHASNETNAIVIGSNVEGEGSYTTVIGNSSTQKTHLYGTVEATGFTINGSPLATAASLSSSLTASLTTSLSASFIPQGNITPNSGSIGGIMAVGPNSAASGGRALAIGGNSSASGDDSIAIGNGTSSLGDYSTAQGAYTITESAYETATGRYNLHPTPTIDTSTWSGLDGLFRVGNGDSYTVRSDAVSVLKNGQTTLTNKAWKAATDLDPSTVLADPGTRNDDSDGEALVVAGHTRLKGKVIIEQPQGDISMGIYGD